VLVAVLATSAVLVSTPLASTQVPAPSPPHGLVVPLGTLTGQIGVSASASQRQLVVRLSTPRRGDYYAPQPPPDRTLSGQTLTNRSGTAAPQFRGCGPGCFVSTVSWCDGDNVLTLHVDAPSWRAAAPAPPRRNDSTSTGPCFLSQEPYASGAAPIAVRISQPGQPVRLALGYPAAAINVALTLDTDGRISTETLTDRTHLIHRRFVSPSPPQPPGRPAPAACHPTTRRAQPRSTPRSGWTSLAARHAVGLELVDLGAQLRHLTLAGVPAALARGAHHHPHHDAHADRAGQSGNTPQQRLPGSSFATLGRGAITAAFDYDLRMRIVGREVVWR
jgi:hypothetical protein